MWEGEDRGESAREREEWHLTKIKHGVDGWLTNREGQIGTTLEGGRSPEWQGGGEDGPLTEVSEEPSYRYQITERTEAPLQKKTWGRAGGGLDGLAFSHYSISSVGAVARSRLLSCMW